MKNNSAMKYMLIKRNHIRAQQKARNHDRLGLFLALMFMLSISTMVGLLSIQPKVVTSSMTVNIPEDTVVKPSMAQLTIENVEPVKVQVVKIEPFKVVQGGVSYYSHAGCLGCSANQITASGEAFDENAMTFAIPAEWRREIPMGTRAVVTNLDNGISVEAKANDTGGFYKYGRIADLSKGLMEKLQAKTDRSNIKIEFYK